MRHLAPVDGSSAGASASIHPSISSTTRSLALLGFNSSSFSSFSSSAYTEDAPQHPSTPQAAYALQPRPQPRTEPPRPGKQTELSKALGPTPAHFPFVFYYLYSPRVRPSPLTRTMASSNAEYQAILNDLNRDVARQQPEDIIQFCADWFQDKLKHQVSRGCWVCSSTAPDLQGIQPRRTFQGSFLQRPTPTKRIIPYIGNGANRRTAS